MATMAWLADRNDNNLPQQVAHRRRSEKLACLHTLAMQPTFDRRLDSIMRGSAHCGLLESKLLRSHGTKAAERLIVAGIVGPMFFLGVD